MESSTGSVRRGCFHSGARVGWVFGVRHMRTPWLETAAPEWTFCGSVVSRYGSEGLQWPPLQPARQSARQRSCRCHAGPGMARCICKFKIRSGATSLTASRKSRECHIVLLAGQRRAGMSSIVVINTQGMLCCGSHPCQKRAIIQHILRDNPNHKPSQYQAQSCQPFRSHCWEHACLVKTPMVIPSTQRR